MTIAIVDYGAGNLTSVKKAIDYLNHVSVITSDPETVASADRVIVPGVGHFAATGTLEVSGQRQAIASAIQRGKPVLGICLGMQWMFDTSTEAPTFRGLGFFSGQCDRFPVEVKSPHVGWNQLQCAPGSRLLAQVKGQPFVYFTHSYRVPIGQHTVASCEYGGTFSAAVERDCVFGVQFHPEKSGVAGLKLLDDFCSLPC
jgi:imidazole glycerol-phosphate synthase subunit HisH